MKNKFILSLILTPLFLVGCNKPTIDMPNSPFKDDTYKRVGMNGEYTIVSNMNPKDFNNIKNYVSNLTDDSVVNYKREEESRDLKYAYFGKESSSISQCSMISHTEDITAYPNRITITNDTNNQETQSANSGIIKTKTILHDYLYDTGYKGNTFTDEYSHRLSTKNNEEKEVVTSFAEDVSYSDASMFNIKPAQRIADRFAQSDIKDKFKLAGDNVMYGKTSDDKYLIREGYSSFIDFNTTMGRTYKAVNNYFYEGLLEKYDKTGEDAYRFTNFRFYRELLILSKAFVKNVPIIYLTKPVLIEYSEVKYTISYNPVSAYTEDVPEVTDPS